MPSPVPADNRPPLKYRIAARTTITLLAIAMMLTSCAERTQDQEIADAYAAGKVTILDIAYVAAEQDPVATVELCTVVRNVDLTYEIRLDMFSERYHWSSPSAAEVLRETVDLCIISITRDRTTGVSTTADWTKGYEDGTLTGTADWRFREVASENGTLTYEELIEIAND